MSTKVKSSIFLNIQIFITVCISEQDDNDKQHFLWRWFIFFVTTLNKYQISLLMIKILQSDCITFESFKI